MPIVALSGLHGGTGATTVTAGLAWALHQAGESVLAIDLSVDNLLRLHFNMPWEQARGWARAELDGEVWVQGAMAYDDRLAFLPFGRTTAGERRQLRARDLLGAGHWRRQAERLAAGGRYRWILLDAPWENSDGGGLAAAGDYRLVVVRPDANCHVRLHQQPLPAGCQILINDYSPLSRLQQDIHQLWSLTLTGLAPVVIHRDEAVAEALAAKQPLGAYRPESAAAAEFATLAGWCLIHYADDAP
ncbi:cellulose biosynthesis protein BcsQ [Martelella alba]|uniref:Cellulose synthase operon protein YhjQ n=1 Tax=Martelella alba TaxID=2590451 RepID=A0ABY2SSC1_9HYPH|nr:cellulose biosynthesis protein BcsQ [Martelella alba]TKI07813.1 cellulose synthase operon protein YhjQ [Martelella alba]